LDGARRQAASNCAARKRLSLEVNAPDVDGFKDLKTSVARWRGSTASGSASSMSSPGACANGRVGVGYQPIRFAAVASISAPGSLLSDV
jgi:hypothetical protein